MNWFQRVFSRHRLYDDSTQELMEQKGKKVWQWPNLESIWADTRFALRQMRKAPAFTFTVVLLLGLGIGSVSAVFSIVDAVLLTSPPAVPRPSIPWKLFASIETASSNYWPLSVHFLAA
jgi:hypothetical protein